MNEIETNRPEANRHDNKISISMESKSQNEFLARTIVAAFIAPIDPDINDLTDIKTAISEAVTNAVIHGYKNGEGQIELTMTLKNGELHVIVTDYGVGISNISKAREPMFTTLAEIDHAGMGFTVMEKFMDTVTVTSDLGKGTTVEMYKKLTKDL
ncbi:MAG: anti-sigma F factor [Defluviitaleaceae bacterium]|nr:anti-sigma F factor [Defluviitaleaceae bacterium]